NYDTNLYRSAVATLKTDGSFSALGTLSGKTLVVSGNGSFTGSVVVRKGISGATLEVLGTASGADLYATRSITGTNIYAASTFGGAGLADCDIAGTSKLLWDVSTKRFSCGTDQTGGSAGTSSFSGGVLRLADARYVKKQGDTMTGALTIDITGGNRNTLGLRVLNTISGAIIHAENLLTSSGGEIIVGRDVNKAVSVIRNAVSQVGNLQEWQASNGSVLAYINPNGTASFQSVYNLSTYATTKLGTDGSSVMIGNTNTPKALLDVAGTISGKTLVISGNGSFSGSLIAKSISGTTLEILGTASGQNLFATKSISGTYLYAATTFGGAGLASCSNATTSKLLYNSATKQFSCGTDQTGGSAGTASFSGSVLLLGDARYVKKQGDTMTGAL
ncbi:MAG TPA: hypothetical protein PKV72_07090, partial [Candidatus Peribacteria bacterium]|nr:hypothetical protein [Candidatus Peribacteria bacterium]